MPLDPGAPSPRRSGRLPHAAGSGHDRDLPGRIARADGDAAAAAARAVLRHRRGGGDHPSRSDRRPDGAPVSEAAAGAEPVRTRTRRSSRSSARTLGVPLFQEQLLRMAMVAAGFSGGEAEELRRAFGLQAIRAADAADRGAAARRHGEAGHHRRGGGRDHPVDHLVRAVWLSRVARGQLRAARVCERVSEGALPGGVLHRAAQQPADGVLPSGDAREGRAAPRRAVRADRRAGVRLGLPRRPRRPRAAGTAVCEWPAPGNRQGDRRCRAARMRDPRCGIGWNCDAGTRRVLQ